MAVQDEIRRDFGGKLNLSILEAARAIGCGRSTVYSLLAAKQLHAVKLRSRTLIPVRSVLALIASLEARP
jgi:excisionase family DNA binding protein